MTRPQKVLFLSRRYLPHIGGVEKHIEHISAQMQRRGYEVSLLTEQDDPQEPLYETMAGVNVFRLPLPQQRTAKSAIWCGILKHLSLFWEADVIHIHDVWFWILPIYPWLWLRGKRLFITFHGYEGEQNPTPKARFWHQVAARFSWGNICIGGFHEKWYGVTPSQISFGAVGDLPSKNIDSRSKTGTKHILFAGRLSDDVGILIYLHALRQIAKRTKVHLDVYGDGPQLAEAKELVVQYHLPVTFYGFLAGSQIKWQNYDVAFVSRYLAILEGLRVGLPVISVYNVAIKYDYLLISPFRSWIIAAASASEVVAGWKEIHTPAWQTKQRVAQTWAGQQTWEKLTNQYLLLWKGGMR